MHNSPVIDPKQIVLILDDNPENLKILEKILGNTCKIISVKSGGDAIAAMIAVSPDLVILPTQMPGLNGYEVCKKIRSQSVLKATNIILVSEMATYDERVKGYKAGANDYITSPFLEEELSVKALFFLSVAKIENEFHSTNQDLTEKVRLRSEQLLKVERSAFIGMHAAEIAHDINSPLAIISGCIMLLQKKYPDEDKLATLRQATEKVLNIIRTLLQNGQEENELAVGNFSIHSVIDSELELFALDSFFKKHVIVEKSLTNLPLYFGNISHFRRCFGNLIKNAADSLHGRDQKKLTISTQQTGNNIVVQFKDTGCGISPENLEKIFDPFYTTKSLKFKEGEPSGTGLGLPSVKRILAGYGGRIQFSSQVGIGTIATVLLPIR